MSKVLITPVASCGVAPFEVIGTLKSKNFPNDGLIYYISGSSYPASIVTILEGIATSIELNDMNC